MRLSLVLASFVVLAAATETPSPEVKTAGDIAKGSVGFLADIFRPLVDVSFVCEPDVKVCPSGARAYRSHEHDCEFTPCDLLEAPPVTEMPNPRMFGAPEWYSRAEFIVPRLHFRDVRRGRDLLRRVDRMLVNRARSCNNRTRRRQGVASDGESFFYLGCIDLYLLDPPSSWPSTSPDPTLGYMSHSSTQSDAATLDVLRNALLKDALTPARDKKDWGQSMPPTPFVVEVEPFTRYAYAARTLTAVPPSASHIEALVGMELERMMLATGLMQDSSNYIAPLLVVQVNETLEMNSTTTIVDEKVRGEMFDWDAFGIHSPAMRAKVVNFFELRRLAILNYLASVEFLPVVHNKTLEEGELAHEMVFSSIAMTVFVTRVKPGFCLEELPGNDCVTTNATTTWLFRSTCSKDGFSNRRNDRQQRREREKMLNMTHIGADATDSDVAYGCSDGGWRFYRAPEQSAVTSAAAKATATAA